ncbi:MAG: hypothetical protein KKA19_07180 [Candidatus Margulisbacteria bacterium]|nr:hypothetical protein [Candidatus Margulisiibacteriota bacterium]
MKIDSAELGEYVKSTIEGIEKGLKEGYQLKGEIEFELAVINTKEGEGGLKIKIVNVGGSLSNENVSKIKFKVGRHYKPYIA